MYALTVWQPWADAIAHGGKDVENRPWAAPRQVIGQCIAIHAGRQLDRYARPPGELVLPDWPGPASRVLPRGAIVAVVLLAGCHHESRCSRSCSPWAAGPWHWHLTERRALTVPVPARGFQRFWRLPSATERAVIADVEGRACWHG